MRNPILGIVLAGGQSSRMGRSKALLDFCGRPLLMHMCDLVGRSGVDEVVISGEVPGYPGIQDRKPHAGPAQAIVTILQKRPGYRGYLFVPVDMPFLTPETLHVLLQQSEGAYFTGYPLPAFIVPGKSLSDALSVRELLSQAGVTPVDISPEQARCLYNANTPQDWQEAVSRA